MNKYLVGFCLLFINLLSAQDVSKKSKDQYTPIEITKKDGSIMNVFLYRMKTPRLSTFKEMLEGSGFNSRTKLEYKTSETSPIEKIEAKDIKRIKFLDKDNDEVFGYEKLKVKEFDKNGDLKDAKNEIFLSQVYDGKIGIYGYPNFICTPLTPRSNSKVVCDYSYSIFYLKNNQENFVVMPLDINLFDINRSFDNFVNAFKVAGKECPEFSKYLDSFRKKMEDRSFQKEMRKNLIDFKKELKKQARANDLDEDETLDFITRKMFFYEANLYLGIVKEYEKNCP
jgi:hypothetical protein